MSFTLKRNRKTYVVGTGRSGTHTIAELYDGLHEPEPSIVKESTDFYNGNVSVLKKLEDKLIVRDRLKTKMISDNKNSLVIPIIRKVNPSASFIHLIREPISCIDSFFARGAYSDSELINKPSIFALNRPRPIGNFPKNWSQYMKCAWYWIEINRICIRDLYGTNHKIMLTSELPSNQIHNSSNSKQRALKDTKRKEGLSPNEQKLINEVVLPFWKEIKKYRLVLDDDKRY